MLKIGDFSKLTHVSVRMLRYYDSEGLLKPAAVDPDSGYRMYTAQQVPELQKIVMLRDLSFGVEEIGEMLRHWDDAYLISQLGSKIAETEELIALERKRLEGLRCAISHIEEKKLEQYYNVTIKFVPAYPVISLRRKVPSHFDEGQLWAELMDFAAREHIDYERGSQNNVALYYDDE